MKKIMIGAFLFGLVLGFAAHAERPSRFQVVNIDSTLTVSDSTTLNNTLSVADASTFDRVINAVDLELSGYLSVQDASQFDTSLIIGAGRGSIGASAILELVSTEKAFLPPVMSEVQRDAIGTPEEGMIIYNTDSAVHDFYNGSTWQNIGTGVGDSVINPSTSIMNIASAHIEYTGGTPLVTQQDGAWINKLIDNGTLGDTTVVFETGEFTSSPNCLITVEAYNDARDLNACTIYGTASTGAVRVTCNAEDENNATGAGGTHVQVGDRDFYILCMGDQQ